MTEEQQPLVYDTIDFYSSELEEIVQRKDFEVQGIPVFKFEDKTNYRVEIQTAMKILSRDTGAYGIKFYVPVKIDSSLYYWQCSKGTLIKINECLEESHIAQVRGDFSKKDYSIIPIMDAVEKTSEVKEKKSND